jgi:hypothetical protein
MQMDPLAVDIPRAVVLSGFGRTRIYEEIAAGALATVKNGKRPLIPMDGPRGLRALIARNTIIKGSPVDEVISQEDPPHRPGRRGKARPATNVAGAA